MGERIELDREADQAEDALRDKLAVKEARSILRKRWRKVWYGVLLIMLWLGSLAVFALAARMLGGVR